MKQLHVSRLLSFKAIYKSAHRIAFPAIALLACVSSSYAGLVHQESLRDSIRVTKVILVAEVLEAPSAPVKPSERSSPLWIYRIKVVEVIAGKVPGDTYVIQFARPDYSGMAVEGRLLFSPIAPGSGLETSMQVGEKYLLLFSFAHDFEGSNERPVILNRAEPLSKRQEVLTLWQEMSPREG